MESEGLHSFSFFKMSIQMPNFEPEVVPELKFGWKIGVFNVTLGGS
jgi:hypothetical protein